MLRNDQVWPEKDQVVSWIPQCLRFLNCWTSFPLCTVGPYLNTHVYLFIYFFKSPYSVYLFICNLICQDPKVIWSITAKGNDCLCSGIEQLSDGMYTCHREMILMLWSVLYTQQRNCMTQNTGGERKGRTVAQSSSHNKLFCLRVCNL